MGTFEGVVLSYPPPSRRVGTCEEMVDRIMSFILHPHCDTSLYTWYNYYCILSVLNPWGEEKRVTWRENWRSMENWKRGKGGALEFFKKMSLPSYFLTQLPYPSPSPTPPPPPNSPPVLLFSPFRSVWKLCTTCFSFLLVTWSTATTGLT